MTKRPSETPAHPPRLIHRDQAAAYVGLSPNAFDSEVAAGTFPKPFPLRRTRRLLWDVKALDVAIEAASAEVDRERRKREWEAVKAQRPSANRPWTDRERREREDRRSKQRKPPGTRP